MYISIFLIFTSQYTFFYLNFSYTSCNLHVFLTSPMSHRTYVRTTCFSLTYTLMSVLCVFPYQLWAYIRLTCLSLPPFYLHQWYPCFSNISTSIRIVSASALPLLLLSSLCVYYPTFWLYSEQIQLFRKSRYLSWNKRFALVHCNLDAGDKKPKFITTPSIFIFSVPSSTLFSQTFRLDWRIICVCLWPQIPVFLPVPLSS